MYRALSGSAFSLLDIGTADGIMMEHFQKVLPEGHFTGVERNAALLAVARTKGLDISRADARHLPFPDARFHGVTMVSTLKHIPEYGLVFSEVRRVLKPGGHLIVSDPTPLGLKLGVWRGHFDPRYLAHRWSLKRLRSQVTEGGFHVLAAYRYMPFPVMVPGSRAFERVLTRVRCTHLFMQQILLARRKSL